MLVLSRQRDESVCIADDVIVTVVDIRGDKVRLGFKAPSRYQIHRKEVYDAIVAEIRELAAASNVSFNEAATKLYAVNRPRKTSNGNGQLVLSRQRDEQVIVVSREDWLAPYTQVTIVDVRGDTVRLGFIADRKVTVHRKEVYDSIRAEVRQPAGGQSGDGSDGDGLHQQCA